jgi:transposase
VVLEVSPVAEPAAKPFKRTNKDSIDAVGYLKESDLGRFFKRIAFKKGRQAAITATARKIAVILYNRIIKGEAYKPKDCLCLS